MIAILLAMVMIGDNPPNAKKAAAKSLQQGDYRIAGVSTFWASAAARGSVIQPYGLKCGRLSNDAYSYSYFVSDAVEPAAFEGFRKQIRFLITYNHIMLRSGKLPKSWNCVEDASPGLLPGTFCGPSGCVR